MILSLDVYILEMRENNALVFKEGQLHIRQKEMLSTITKLQSEALQVSDQVASMETRVETLIKESQGIFLNGPTPLETMKDIIDEAT